MNLVRTIIAIFCLTGLGLAQDGPSAPVVETPSAEVQGEHAQESALPQESTPQKSTMDMKNSEFFMPLYGHLVAHPIGAGHGEGEAAGHEVSHFTFYNVNLFQLIALGLMVVVFGLVLGSFRATRTPWVIRVFRGWCRWIRDELVYPVMGKEQGRKFTPYFIYLFFFIAFLNLVGMVPSSVTATACIYVTAALAIITFGMMVFGGMMQQGVLTFWKNLLPHGLPFWLVPLMFVLEVVGLLVKPFALTIRLFANMLAGHLVIYSFIGMIFVFAKLLEMSGWSWLVAVLPAGMGVFISIIEAFVAVLQAYIFTYLSVIFVQQSLHPAH